MTFLQKIMIGGIAFLIIGPIVYGVYHVITSPITKQSATTVSEKSRLSSTSLVMYKDTTAVASTSELATTTEIVKKTQEKKEPFSIFMARGGSYKCDVSQIVANMTTSGTVYFDGPLVRTEFSISIAGQTINTTMISRDGYAYSWTSGAPGKGYKTKIVQPSAKNARATSSIITWNGSQITDYTCEKWSADASFFIVPDSINFTLQ